MTSIIPQIYDYKVYISVALVALLMLGNLRGIRESGSIFMTPTYLYIVVMLGVIGMGPGPGADRHARPVRRAGQAWIDDWNAIGQALGLFLILRAFSQGAVALTGVEAVSDGVPAFKPPEWKNARTTLTWAAVIFGILFLGIAYLGTAIGIVPDPDEEQTVLSLLVRQIAGDGPILILAQVATALILVLAANTSFADFPRLSSFLARDGFLPRQFAFRGERLAFTTGIIALAGMAIALLHRLPGQRQRPDPAVHAGRVHRLHPVAVGHVRCAGTGAARPAGVRGLLINGLGAATTGVVMVVVGVSNFFNGSWLVIVLVPILMVFLSGIRRHYRNLDDRLALERIPAGKEVAAEPIVIVPVARLDRTARQAIAFANSISKTATAVHITNNPESAAELRERWPDWAGATELVVVESPYRALVGPLLRYMDALQAQDPGRPVLVVLSEVVPRHWWENLLHNQTALRLKLRLFARPNTIVADVPYHLPTDEA